MKQIKFFLLACMILLLASGCEGPQDNGGDRIRVGYHRNFGGASAVAIGVEKGYFTEEGLDVELVGFNSGPPSMAALSAGDIDVTFMGHGAFSLVLEGESGIIAVESLSNAEEILTRSESGIMSVSDLVGKRLATPFGTSGENFLDVALNANGINREDIVVVNMDIAGAVSALQSGMVDAISIWAPYTNEVRRMLGSDHVTVLANCMDFRSQITLPMYWVSSEKYIQENGELIGRFVRALYRCLDDRAADLEDAARTTARQLDLDYKEILPDTETAEWLTSESAGRYLADGTMERWFQDMEQFFIQKGAVTDPVSEESFLQFEFMRQVLLNSNENGG